MSFPLIVDGSSYQYPSQGDKANTGWGTQTGGWASAVTSALTKLGLGGTLSPLANTVIDISSTSKGILIPRMTTVQRNAITSVPNSLLIFNTTDKVLQYYDSSVSSWISVGARLPDNAIFSGTLTVNGNITGLGSITATSGLNGATGTFTDTTDATNVDTAPLKTLGGMAVKKKLYVGEETLIGNGLATAPGYSFINDLDSGLYRISDNKIGFAANGARVGEFGVGYGGFTGNIIQVQSTAKTDTSTLSSSFGTISGLSQSITPKYSNSKILIIVNISFGRGLDNLLYFKLLRDSTDIYIGDAAGSRTRSSSSNYMSTGSPGLQANSVTLVFLDFPSTTSLITYNTQGRSDSGSGYINRTGTDTDSSFYMRMASSITVMELQQ